MKYLEWLFQGLFSDHVEGAIERHMKGSSDPRLELEPGSRRVMAVVWMGDQQRGGRQDLQAFILLKNTWLEYAEVSVLL